MYVPRVFITVFHAQGGAISVKFFSDHHHRSYNICYHRHHHTSMHITMIPFMLNICKQKK